MARHAQHGSPLGQGKQETCVLEQIDTASGGLPEPGRREAGLPCRKRDAGLKPMLSSLKRWQPN
eukprot:1158921-Pelagomonas_calceolata.AAC.14